jgi:hypothetical protein
MITLINPPGTKTFSGLQMHTPNPPLGLAYIAAALKKAGLPYQVIDGTGKGLDVVRTLVTAVATGTEDTRYAKWLVDRLHTRRHWCKLAENTPR